MTLTQLIKTLLLQKGYLVNSIHYEAIGYIKPIFCAKTILHDISISLKNVNTIITEAWITWDLDLHKIRISAQLPAEGGITPTFDSPWTGLTTALEKELEEIIEKAI